MKAIICAAGRGRRLGNYTENVPKCLIRIGSKRIIEYALDSLSACGISEVVIVVGYRSNKFKRIIGARHKKCRIKYLINKKYDKTDNMYSLWEARGEINDGFIFLNADILFNMDILKNLISAAYSDAAVIDDKIKLEKSAMKVKVAGDRIVRIGRNLKDGNARAIGIYKYSPEGARKYFSEIKKVISKNKNKASLGKSFGQIEMAIGQFIRHSKLNAIKTGNLAWQEVDDIEDLKKAERKLKHILRK